MKLTVLGCDGSWPGPGGACSGYLVTTETTTLWLDAGPGTFANLQRCVDPRSIDAVVLSHRHTDHWSDMDGFATYARFSLERSSVPVFAPEGVRERSGLGGAEQFVWGTVGDGQRIDVGDLTCTFSRTDHGPPTLAVRVEAAGCSVGYSADSGPGWSPARFGGELDLFLCEATYLRGGEDEGHHLSARQAGQIAKAAGVDRLVLTHRRPTVAAADAFAEGSEAFGAPVELAAIGKEYIV